MNKHIVITAINGAACTILTDSITHILENIGGTGCMIYTSGGRIDTRESYINVIDLIKKA